MPRWSVVLLSVALGACGLGGTFEHSETIWAGQGYLVRDRAGVTAAKLPTVAD